MNKIKREVNELRLNIFSSGSADMSKLENNVGNVGYSEVKVDFSADDCTDSSSCLINEHDKTMDKLLAKAMNFKTVFENQMSDSTSTEAAECRVGMMGNQPGSKLEKLVQERANIVSALTHQLKESRSKVEVLKYKVANLKKDEVIKQKRYVSHLMNFESKISKIKQDDDQRTVEMGRMAKLKEETISNKDNEPENVRSDCMSKGSLLENTSELKHVEVRGSRLKKGDDLTEFRSRLKSGGKNLEKMLNTLKDFMDHKRLNLDEYIYQPSQNSQEKSVALFITMLEIISSWLELIISLSHESYHLELIDIVKNKDAEQVINDFYRRVENMYHQFLICLMLLKEYSPNDKVIVGLFKELKKVSVLTKKKSSNLSGTLSMIESLTETIEHIGYLLQDIQVANLQNITVESRVLVQKKSWCMVKWCPSYSRSNEELKDSSYHKRFWISQKNLVKLFNIAEENYNFPTFLGNTEDEPKSSLKSVRHDKKFIKKNEIDLTDIVHKFLISETNFEEFVSDAKKIINIPPEKAANIRTKF